MNATLLFLPSFFVRLWLVVIRYGNRFAFLAIHIAAFLLPCFFSLTILAFWLTLATYCLRIFAISAGYHRLLSHNSYNCVRWFRFLLAWLACAAFQRGPLHWAADHRDHHDYSDTEKDPHSPIVKGFWNAHIGWVLVNDQTSRDYSRRVPDLVKYPELRFLDKYHWLPGLWLLGVCVLIGIGQGWQEMLSCAVYGFVISTVALYHATFLVNSVCHLFGSRRYDTADHSQNNWWVAFLTFGEGWHNNHHYRQGSCAQGEKWWEVDLSYYILWLLSWTGVVWNLKKHRPKAHC